MKKIRKDNIFKLRMNDSDLKNLNKISKILKITNSETIRLLIELKIKELDKLKTELKLNKTELEMLYSKMKSVRKVAKLIGISYFKTMSIFYGYKIKMRPKGNPFGVPHRTKGYLKIKN